MTRLRSFHLRAARYGGQVAATARQVRVGGSHLRASRDGGQIAATARRVVATAAAVMIVAGGSNLLACPLCFGAEETSMIDGTKLGVLVLLAITLVVQGGFVGFFLYLRRRAKRMADMELDTEWSQLQGAPRTS